MARTGRPPKPIEVKRLQGNPGNRPLPAKTDTVGLVAIEEHPAPITLEAPGRDLWRKAQDSAMWLTELDLFLLEDLCQTQDQVMRLHRALAEDGDWLEEPIVTPAGMVVGTRKVPHPAAKMLESAKKQLQSLASELGFGPTARSRLGLAEVKVRSKLEELAQIRNAR